jgi:hypothetical protein
MTHTEPLLIDSCRYGFKVRSQGEASSHVMTIQEDFHRFLNLINNHVKSTVCCPLNDSNYRKCRVQEESVKR